jgi:hypothetical protein
LHIMQLMVFIVQIIIQVEITKIPDFYFYLNEVYYYV